MSLTTIIVTLVPILCALQHVSAADSLISGRQDEVCPELTLDSGEPLDVGCFDPYLGLYPDTPDNINATFSLYRNRNSSNPFRQWTYNASFNNESRTLLNPSSYLTFIIHGFGGDSDDKWINTMTEALLLQTQPGLRNVVQVDWKSGAEGPNYVQASLNLFMVGRLTANLINRLSVKYNVNPDNIHLIGHSLGGQTVGRITDWLFTRYGTKVGRSTGLDVAAPGFKGLDVYPNKSHSKFLEIVHTASGNDLLSGSVGLKDNFGHIDLYPNGGTVPQPGCPTPPLQIGCSHGRAPTIYTDFLVKCLLNCRYIGLSCSSATDAVHRNCTGPKRDICVYVESLRQRVTDATEEIVYVDTTKQDSSSRCSFTTETPGLVTRLLGRGLSFLYWLLGISRPT